jgi:hypothetical protein
MFYCVFLLQVINLPEIPFQLPKYCLYRVILWMAWDVKNNVVKIFLHPENKLKIKKRFKSNLNQNYFFGFMSSKIIHKNGVVAVFSIEISLVSNFETLQKYQI